MIISDQKVDIFSMHKDITLSGKAYKISFSQENSDKTRYVRINGSITSTRIYSHDVENMTPVFKQEVKSAINQYESDLRRSREYLAWDGKLD